MSDYEIEFFTSERLSELWEIFANLIKFASPGILISISFAAAGLLLTFVIIAFRKGVYDDDEKERDFDIKYYD